MSDAAASLALLHERTTLSSVPLVPEIRLHLAGEVVPLWQDTETRAGRTGLPPPFWAFAWVGGQALARYILDRPECVLGKRVLDVASGSGIVAIAAAKSGAAQVVANDVDPFATAAIAANAAANAVALEICTEDVIGRPLDGVDVVLAGDFFYDRDLADRTGTWFAQLCRRGTAILIGDPGRAYLPKESLAFVAAYDVPSTREIEDADAKRCTVYRWKE